MVVRILPEKHNNIRHLLAQIKLDFLYGLASRCYDLENLVMQLVASDRNSNQFQELYRIIHSLKGAGGTHGLPLITAICHHFEDLLQGELAIYSEEFTNKALCLIDLLHEISKVQPDNEVIELQRLTDKFNQFCYETANKQPTVLILETSRTVILLLQAMLNEHNIKTICMTESLYALQRMLSERFDMIIVSQETPMLSGKAIINAIQTNQGYNKDTPFVLLTSSTELNCSELPNTKIVDRSTSFTASLNPAILRLLEIKKTTKNHVPFSGMAK